MGEILRAICDASCVYSAPAFYVGRITSFPTVGARTYVQRQGVIQLKADTFFLMMAWSQDIGITGWEQKVAASTFLVQDMKTSKTYGNLPIMKSNGGYNLNNIVTLPHYVLFDPSTLVGIIQTVPLTDNTGATQADSFVTLVGIEYKMGS